MIRRSLSRFAHTMSWNVSTNVTTAPFSRAVVSAMRKLYPEELADRSWDNTGLLLEAPLDPLRRQMNSVLLTVDLTKAVADEAIERGDSVVIAYHPIIFRGLKSLTMADSQQQSLLRLAAEGISVYSPHTALDTAAGGICDWLADIVTGTPATAPQHEDAEVKVTEAEPDDEDVESNADGEDPFVAPKRPTYLLRHHPSHTGKLDLKLATTPHKRHPITPLDLPNHPKAGAGRIVRFHKPQPLGALIERIGRGLGNPKGIPLAVPQGVRVADLRVRGVAICPGSGGSVFARLAPDADVDLLLTGELSHHETLAATERGRTVIALFHSNSERGFLSAVLRERLRRAVREEWDRARVEEQKRADVSEEVKEALADEFVSVEVSERDRDPYGILVAG